MIKTLAEIAEIINKANSVLLFCHVKPDGDTLGSAAALALAIGKTGKTADVVCDGDLPKNLNAFSFFKGILKPEQVSKSYDLHIAVDVPTEALLGTAWGIYSAGKNKAIVDHHMSNERYADHVFISDEGATCVIIGELIKIMGVECDKDIAEALLIGIITDTGCFTHINTDSTTLDAAAKCIRCGADYKKTVYHCYLKQSKARATFFARVMSSMRFYLDDKLAVIVIKKDELAARGLTAEDTVGMVDFPLSVEGVEVAVSLLETKNELYRVSFRSSGKVNAHDIAGEFGGGGHIFASGCVVKGPLEEVIEKIVRATDVNM